jgi:bud site selection protein 20
LHLDVSIYETDAALTSHRRSKVHKRRCKQLKEPAYTIEESERAAGLRPAERKPPTVAAVMDDVALAT